MSILLAVFAIACSEDDANFNGPYRLNIVGSSEVRPESSGVEYTLGDFSNPEDYSWTVEGPATINGSATGKTIIVDFQEVGNVTISVTNGGDANGHLTVVVAETEPAVTASLNGTGVLKSGASDTVFFDFDAPIQGTPTLEITSDSTQLNAGKPFISGTLGALTEIDADSYYAVYTAGSGNGLPEAVFYGIESTDDYGAVTVDTAYVQLYRVDNIAPVATLSYSSTTVNDSTVLTVTATFTEPVRNIDPMDSAILISFSGAGVAAETDTLEATDDPLVYTYDYVVNGNVVGPANLDVDISNAMDMAANVLAPVNNTSEVVIENTDPTILLNNAVAGADAGTAVFSMTSSDTGTGWYLILDDGDDAPTELSDFEGSASFDLSAGVSASRTISIAQGDYDVYFIAGDEYGNYSDISAKVDLTVN